MPERAKRIRSIKITTIPFACLAVLLSCGGDPTTSPGPLPVTPPAQQEIPISGAAMAGLEIFETSVRDVMQNDKLPGGAVALVRDGKP